MNVLIANTNDPADSGLAMQPGCEEASDFLHSLERDRAVGVAFSAGHRQQHVSGMEHVLAPVAPFKVFESVIGLQPALVVDMPSYGIVKQERFGNETVYAVNLPDTFSVQMDERVATKVSSAVHDSRLPCVPVVQRPYSSLIGDFVPTFVPDDCLPLFGHGALPIGASRG